MRARSLLLLVLLVACGPLPRPFQPLDKSRNELARLGDGASIYVRPLQLDQPGPSTAAAAALTAALQARNLPASTRHAGPQSRVLVGRASIQPTEQDQDELLFYWELREADGARSVIHSQRGLARAGAWQAGEPAVVAELMEAAALAIAARLQPATQQTAAIPGFPGARLVIEPPRGAPGDGNRRLAQAMAAALTHHNLPLAERPGRADLLLSCLVELGPPRALWQELRVTWALSRAADGTELGRLEQANSVPVSQLTGPWSPLAEAIAQDAAEGLLDLVVQLAATAQPAAVP